MTALPDTALITGATTGPSQEGAAGTGETAAVCPAREPDHEAAWLMPACWAIRGRRWMDPADHVATLACRYPGQADQPALPDRERWLSGR